MVRIKKLRKEPGVNATFDLEEPEGLPWNEAPEGLVPIGDTGLYATPDEPADPRDCDRYPDSIYCGNPFTPSFAEFEPSFILDKCNVGVQFDGAFGFIKVPPVAIVWRLPECRNPPPPLPIELPPGTDSPVPFPPHNCQDTSTSIIVIYKAFQADTEEWNNQYPNSISGVNVGRHYARSVITRNVTNIEFPYTGTIVYRVAVKCGRTSNNNNPPPPRKLSPPPKHCCMSCCPTNNNNDDLVRLLIAKIDKLSRIVGVDEYPASLPASLISRDEGFLGNLIPNANTSIPNLTRLISWYVERFDEIMGQWEIPIEVKDSDPTKPGDQPVGFKLPNMAEAIAEMFGLMLQTSINSETLINMNTRVLLEEGQIKQQGFKTYMMATAIADHLGFEYKDTKHKIPMLFKIGEEELDKLLQESTLEVTAPEHTDTSDLKTTFNDLLQAAAIIRAVHFRQFDPKQDVKQQFKNLINNLVASGDKVNKQQTDSAGKDDFDRFIEDVETGFTQYPGASDSTHPYGRNYNERPKIKEISIDTSESDNNGSQS